MLDQFAEKNTKEKTKKLNNFTEQLESELKTAESLKSEHPDRADLNALIELLQAITEETKAVADLVKIGEDCSDDWVELEDARSSLQRTQARVQYQNWVTLGPSRSKRINQLFFYQKQQPGSKESTALIQELRLVGDHLLNQGLNPELQRNLKKLMLVLDQTSSKGFLRKLSEQVTAIEESMDSSLLDAPVNGEQACTVCGGELEPGGDRCQSCGATFLTVQKASVEKEEEATRSQLVDSLNHSWKLFCRQEINQENLQRILKTLSEQISGAVAALDSPTATLLDFSTRLEMFTQLRDRATLEAHWPSLIASAKTLVNERLQKLEREG